MRRIAILIISAYRYCISPLLGPCCRFYPSCSSYAVEAIEKYGLWRGGAKAFWRICRCQPFSPGGCDPVE